MAWSGGVTFLYPRRGNPCGCPLSSGITPPSSPAYSRSASRTGGGTFLSPPSSTPRCQTPRPEPTDRHFTPHPSLLFPLCSFYEHVLPIRLQDRRGDFPVPPSSTPRCQTPRPEPTDRHSTPHPSLLFPLCSFYEHVLPIRLQDRRGDFPVPPSSTPRCQTPRPEPTDRHFTPHPSSLFPLCSFYEHVLPIRLQDRRGDFPVPRLPRPGAKPRVQGLPTAIPRLTLLYSFPFAPSTSTYSRSASRFSRTCRLPRLHRTSIRWTSPAAPNPK